MSEHDQTIARINALTSNARNTWFALLSALLFVGVTLMGVEHIDFYGVDRATQLPLINVSVPTPLFFYAAPLLMAAIYGYFHLYLIRLWDALGSAPARVNGDRLGDAIAPWLVTDAALHLRGWLRQDNCCTPRALEWASMLLNSLLAWGLGLVVLGGIWWLSMPARDWMMTSIAGASLIAACFSGFTSFVMFIQRMRQGENLAAHKLWSSAPSMGAMLVVVPFIFVVGLQRTSGSSTNLAPLNLTGKALVEKPINWLPDEISYNEFLSSKCQNWRENCSDLEIVAATHSAEWTIRRDAQIASLRKPKWSSGEAKQTMDFRNAKLSKSFLSGANLIRADLKGSDLRGAHLQKANLSWANLQGADLRWAQMQRVEMWSAELQGAILWGTKLQNANLFEAQLQGANLSEVHLQFASLWRAKFQNADLRWAKMQQATLWEAEMAGANLSGAQLQSANLQRANMRDAELSEAQLQGAVLLNAQLQNTVFWRANLSISLLSGQRLLPSELQDTNIRSSLNQGGALRYADLTKTSFDQETDWRNVYLDASVSVPTGFREQMGGLCQQTSRELNDNEFYAHWRGWLEAAPEGFEYQWADIAPEGYQDIPPIAPPGRLPLENRPDETCV